MTRDPTHLCRFSYHTMMSQNKQRNDNIGFDVPQNTLGTWNAYICSNTEMANYMHTNWIKQSYIHTWCIQSHSNPVPFLRYEATLVFDGPYTYSLMQQDFHALAHVDINEQHHRRRTGDDKWWNNILTTVEIDHCNHDITFITRNKHFIYISISHLYKWVRDLSNFDQLHQEFYICRWQCIPSVFFRYGRNTESDTFN